MKLFSSILILLLLVLSAQSRGQCSKNMDCSKGNLTWQTNSNVQPVILQNTFTDEQDTNDIDGPEFFIINPTPPVNPFQHKATTITIVLPFTFQVQMNKLLVDLPPPSLS